MRLPHGVIAPVAVSALLLAGLAGCTSSHDAGSGGTLIIGADLDSSSSVDTAYARALQLRVDQLNASGQLGDRKLALQTKDNHSDPTTALRDITAFADDANVIAVVSGSCDACVAQSAKTIDDKQIPVIALSASDDVVIPVDQRTYVFKLGPNSVDSAATMVNELVRVKMTSASVLYTDDLYGQGAVKAITAELGKATIKQPATRSVKPTATDVSQAVSALVAPKPDALIVLAGPDQASLAAVSARKAGFKGKIYFDAAAAGDQFIATADATYVDNATMVFTQTLAIDDVIATTPAKAARQQWFRDYTSRYGDYSGVAAFAADASDLIADAAVRAGTDRSRLRDIIETSQIDGLSGPIRFTPDNHSGLMPQALTLLVARAGRWRLAS